MCDSIHVIGPLRNVRVLDMTHTLAGPMATMLLGDYGADVIKIERPGTGDETRAWGPPFVENAASGCKESAYYLCLNRNKRSVTVNIKHSRGQKLLHQLAAQSDVFIANFPGEKLSKYQLGWEELRRVNERLVYVSITGYGKGPAARRPAYDLIMEGESGLTDLISRLAGSLKPLTAGLPVADIFTGLYAHGAVMAGLMQRERTGRGVHLETSLFEAQLAALTNFASNALLGGHDHAHQLVEASSHHPSLTPYQPFPAQDTYFNIAANNNEQFSRLATTLGHPEWAIDARFCDNAHRTAHRSELVELITAVTRTHSSSYWIERLTAAGVPCGRINTIQQALAHEQVEPNGMIQRTMHPQLGPLELIGPAVKVDGTIREIRPPPTLGQDTRSVLRTMLQLSDAEIDALYQDGVL